MSTFSEGPSKSFAHTLSLAIESGCLTFRDTIPWADSMVARLDHPPLWICDLSTVKYRPEALRVVREYLSSEPFEQIDTPRDDYLGFLWIRYERRELSWATFLREAGEFSDRSNGSIDCEYFYSMLNELEEAEFGIGVENSQREAVRKRLGEAIGRSTEFYESFRKKV